MTATTVGGQWFLADRYHTAYCLRQIPLTAFVKTAQDRQSGGYRAIYQQCFAYCIHSLIYAYTSYQRSQTTHESNDIHLAGIQVRTIRLLPTSAQSTNLVVRSCVYIYVTRRLVLIYARVPMASSRSTRQGYERPWCGSRRHPQSI